MISSEPEYRYLGPGLEAHLYYTDSRTCSAFSANTDKTKDLTTTFNGNTYSLPAWSVSILPDCKNVVFNTAKVTTLTTSAQLEFVESTNGTVGPTWKWYKEPIGIWGPNAFTKNGLVDQINMTGDSSDYLWYPISFEVTSDELADGTWPFLDVKTLGHALHIFINKQYIGTGTGSNSNPKFTMYKPIFVKPGKNTLDLLSMTVGLKNIGPYYDTEGAGITGPITLKGLKSGTQDLSMWQRTYQIGLQDWSADFYCRNAVYRYDVRKFLARRRVKCSNTLGDIQGKSWSLGK
ncbi:hypothetical protein SUGI_0145700 [Cryptomeria japonica]|nr:hypothetical protein SUGI_0145700 [Cryptomeria japonica]